MRIYRKRHTVMATFVSQRICTPRTKHLPYGHQPPKNTGIMKKLYFLLLAASVVAGSANAQLRVDSLGRSEFGTRPDEVMDKLRVAQTTFYGEAGAPVLNLYADRSTTLSYNSGDYFLQCIYGNTNEENGDNHLIFSQEKTFEWVFYVTHSGIVYAKLVIDAEGEVLIKNGFTCEASAMLEIK